MATNYREFYRELRTDWLKLRGCLFDTNTRLPALPAVLDQVRRRLEDGESLGLIYVDPSRSGHLESSCGWQAYDRMVLEVAETLRDYRLSHLGERDVVAQTGVRSDEFILFVGVEGEDRSAVLEALRTALVGQIGTALEALDAELYKAARLQSSAILLHSDPKVRLERSIYHCLQNARELCRRESDRRDSRRLVELRRMLAEDEILTRYQPIVELTNGGIYGLEALSSALSSDVFPSAETLFSFAEKTEVLVELERLCRRQATREAVALLRHDGLAAGGKLFINCSALAFADPELPGSLARGSLAAGLDPNDLVIEVTERVAITEWQIFRRALRNLRDSGLRIAIDDMGSGYSSLHAVAEIQPDYLKFDISLIHNIHQSSIKRDLLETLVVLAGKIGACSIAEGIEKLEELDTLREMGVQLGQGFFLAAPAAPADIGRVHFPIDHPSSRALA